MVKSPPSNLKGNLAGTKATEGPFLHRLESLRGIAALMVAGQHCFEVMKGVGGDERALAALLTLANGNAAVTVFFVLSGFVLGHTMHRRNEPFASQFVRNGVRRTLRIYPAFLISTLVVILCAPLFHALSSAAALSPRLATLYRDPLSADLIFKHLMFVSFDLNNPVWTLRMEMICSFLLPVVHWLSIRSAFHKAWLFAGIAGLAALLPHKASAGLGLAFFVGYWMPSIESLIFNRLRRNRILNHGLSALMLVAFFSARHLSNVPAIHYGLETLAATFLIGGMVFGPDHAAYRVLDLRIVRLYGRISYSFYLLHFLVMYMVASLLLPVFSKWFLADQAIWIGFLFFFVSVFGTTPLAWASFRWIEQPLMLFSKQLRSKKPEPARPVVLDMASPGACHRP